MDKTIRLFSQVWALNVSEKVGTMRAHLKLTILIKFSKR